jgi:chloramphenicol 3-O phosphotransferase
MAGEDKMPDPKFRCITFIVALMPVFFFGVFPKSKISAGTIILLNGPSASGKSSIQDELQKQMTQLYLKIGIDSFFDALIATPDLSSFEATKEFSQFTNDGVLIRRVRLVRDSLGNQIVPLEVGPAGDRIIFGMHSAIAAYANEGNHIVVDYILYKKEWIPNLVQALEHNNVYLIGVKAPLDVLEERERKRATSPVGHARSHHDTVHSGMIYDLELDASTMTPEEIARTIRLFVEENRDPKAIRELAKLYNK